MEERILGDEKGKVTPEVLQVVYLDEIAGRLEDLNSDLGKKITLMKTVLDSVDKRIGGISDYLDSTSYEGDILIVKKVITGGTGNKKISCNKTWFEYTLFNDGPDDVFIESSKKAMTDTGITNGDQITAKSKKGSSKPVWVRCVKDETATVRVAFKM